MSAQKNSPTRILFSSHTAVRKGSAMSLHTLLCGIDRSRYEPVVLFGDEGSLMDDMRSMGIPAYIKSRSAGLADLPLLFTAWRIIKRHKIELVHVNCALTYSRVIAQAANLAGVPVIWHVRENPYSNKVLKRRKAMQGLASEVFVVSEEQREALADLSVPVRHIANGVVIDRFKRPVDVTPHRQRLALPDGHLTFCIVGTIEPRKGTEALVKAFAELRKEQKDCQLVIVGAGPDGYEESLRNLIASCDSATSAAIHCTGRINEVESVMWASDVLVMPSTWEGFPRSLIEGMAAGLPAIGTDVGDTRYILDDGVTGWLIERNDPAQLLAALRDAVNKKAKLAGMGVRAAKNINDKFTAERHAERMQTGFDEVLGLAAPRADD